MAKQLMRFVATSVLLACAAGIPAGATILQQLTFDDMARKSTSIVRAKVTASSEIARGGNVFTELMEAVRCCSLGQITDALFEVGGRYRRNV